jgi:cell division septation protein DedD
MSDLTFPQPNSENMELAAANRRLTTAILGMTLLTGLIACLSYLAGRTVTQIRTEAATVVRTEIPAAPVIVNPLQKPSPLPAPMPTAPAAAAPPAVPTGIYLQVGLINPAVDRSMNDKLHLQGYLTRLAPMENSTVFRLLVGPIQSAAEQRELEGRLRTDGYQFFPRRF